MPSTGVLLIEHAGLSLARLREVRVDAAEVMRLWRAENEPWRGRTRDTGVHRLAVGTFVAVIGRSAPEKRVTALRPEVPLTEETD